MSTDRPNVVVLLSTHNGAPFVAAQIRSVLSQTYRHFRLNIRDDGSTDGTRLEVAAFLTDARVHATFGERIGISASFRMLLEDADAPDVVLYCDQDDVWEPTRIERAVASLAQTSVPTLYGGSFRLFVNDAEHGFVHGIGGQLGLGNAIVQNRFAGCVSALNRPLVKLILDNPCPPGILHDHWAYLLASAKGTFVVDPYVVVNKRNHASNATMQPGRGRFRSRFAAFRMARVDSTVFDLPAKSLLLVRDIGDHEALLRSFLRGKGLRRGLRLLVTRKYWRSPLREDLLYRASLCARRFR